MSIGDFWSHVLTLCLVYNGDVIAGPCSNDFNQLLGRHSHEKYVLGLACDVRLRDYRDLEPCMDSAGKLGLIAMRKDTISHELKITTP